MNLETSCQNNNKRIPLKPGLPGNPGAPKVPGSPRGPGIPGRPWNPGFPLSPWTVPGPGGPGRPGGPKGPTNGPVQMISQYHKHHWQPPLQRETDRRRGFNC